MKHHAKRLLFVGLGLLSLVIGFIGILIPVIPGILFLAIAAALFMASSTRLQRTMRRNRRFRPYFERYDSAHGLTEFERFKLAAWLSVSALTAYLPGRRSA